MEKLCLSGSSQCCWFLWTSKQKIVVSFACSLNIEYSVKSKISHMEKLEENKELESEAAFWMIDKSQLLVCFCSQFWTFPCLPSPLRKLVALMMEHTVLYAFHMWKQSIWIEEILENGTQFLNNFSSTEFISSNQSFGVKRQLPYLFDKTKYLHRETHEQKRLRELKIVYILEEWTSNCSFIFYFKNKFLLL